MSEAHRKRMVDGLEARLASAGNLPDGYAAQAAGEVLLRVYKTNGNSKARHRVLCTIADTYLRQSRQVEAGVAIARLQDFASRLEQEGLRSDAEVLRLEMEKRGPKAVSSMRAIQVELPVPVDELNAALEEWLAVGHPIVALVRLVRDLIPTCDRLRQLVKEREEQFTFTETLQEQSLGATRFRKPPSAPVGMTWKAG